MRRNPFGPVFSGAHDDCRSALRPIDHPANRFALAPCRNDELPEYDSARFAPDRGWRCRERRSRIQSTGDSGLQSRLVALPYQAVPVVRLTSASGGVQNERETRDELTRLRGAILTTIAPDSSVGDFGGGRGRIATFRRSLLIYNTAEVHEQIAGAFYPGAVTLGRSDARDRAPKRRFSADNQGQRRISPMGMGAARFVLTSYS